MSVRKVCAYAIREKERERERQGERDRERRKKRQRETERERQTYQHPPQASQRNREYVGDGGHRVQTFLHLVKAVQTTGPDGKHNSRHRQHNSRHRQHTTKIKNTVNNDRCPINQSYYCSHPLLKTKGKRTQPEEQSKELRSHLRN